MAMSTLFFVTSMYFVLCLSTWAPPGLYQYPPAFLQPTRGSWEPCIDGSRTCLCRGPAANCTLTRNYYSDIVLSAENITTFYCYFYFDLLPYDPDSPLYFFSSFFKNLDKVTTLYINSDADLSRDLSSIIASFERVETVYLELHHHEQTAKVQSIGTRPTLRDVYISKSKVDFSSASWWFWPQKPAEFRAVTLIHCDPFKLKLKELNLVKNLTVFHLRQTELLGIEYDDNLTRLEQLSSTNNYLTSVPKTCDAHHRSYFPNLKFLVLDGNEISSLPPRICLPSLEYLSLQSNPFARIISNQFPELNFPKLSFLSLTRVDGLSEISAFAFSNPHLQTLDLSYNNVDFSSAAINDSAFAGCPSLSKLNLEGNFMQASIYSNVKRLFAPLGDSLQLLNLRKTQIRKVLEGTFKPLKRISHLYLNDTGVVTIQNGAFDDLAHLHTLRLDNNYITTFDEDAFSSKTLGQLKILNLSGNPFECTCSLLWLHNALLSDPGLFDAHNPYSRYDCNNLLGTRVIDTFVIEQQCLLGHDAYVFTVVCSAMLIFTLTTAMLLYRYRWHIRLAMYDAFRGNPEARWRQRRPEDFQYDLFVSYDSEDCDWVLNHLMPVLEQQMALRLCVHQRDFIPGKNITDNIVDSLAASKRVLALFSPSFAESQWCQFELELCLSHVVDNDDVMVVVILEHVPARDMSGAMMALLKTTTYIEWEHGQEAEASFWRRMTLALNDILPGCRQ